MGNIKNEMYHYPSQKESQSPDMRHIQDLMRMGFHNFFKLNVVFPVKGSEETKFQYGKEGDIQRERRESSSPYQKKNFKGEKNVAF
jgi:hypothetical protein